MKRIVTIGMIFCIMTGISGCASAPKEEAMPTEDAVVS